MRELDVVLEAYLDCDNHFPDEVSLLIFESFLELLFLTLILSSTLRLAMRSLRSSGASLLFVVSEVGGENGAKRSPLPGIQAQRPSPSHRTHDTTDQWREIVRRLGRSEAYFPPLLPSHENTSRVAGELRKSFRSF